MSKELTTSYKDSLDHFSTELQNMRRENKSLSMALRRSLEQRKEADRDLSRFESLVDSIHGLETIECVNQCGEYRIENNPSQLCAKCELNKEGSL